MNYDNIFRLDNPVYSLLAVGYFSFGALSGFLDTFIAFPIAWHSCGWFFWFVKRHHHATWKAAAAIVALFSAKEYFKRCNYEI